MSMLTIKETDSKILSEDLARIAEDYGLQFGTDGTGKSEDPLANQNVFITGATGLVGSLLVKAFAAINRTKNLNMTIYPVVRNMEKAELVFGNLAKREDLCFITADITEANFTEHVMEKLSDGRADYIIHCAAVTTSKTMVERPVDTIEAAITGTRNLLELAKNARTKSFVYVSSMEVYGDMSVLENTRATEDKLGYVNPQAVRSNYPESKRMCENMCTAYLSQYGVPVKTARLAQTFGAGILPWENRVFAQFARSAMNGTDIVLHTEGKSEGNYCYTADVAEGILTILLKGENGEAYNVVNETTHTTIANMAKLVADEIADGNISVVFDIPKENTYGYAADTKLTLDGGKLMRLGWTPKIGLKEAYLRMIEGMKESV